MEQFFLSWGWFLSIPLSLTFLLWELQFPGKHLNYIAEFSKEFLPIILRLAFTFISVQLVMYAAAPILSSVKEVVGLSGIFSTPIWLRIVIGVVLADFIYYILHWQMHYNSKILWRLHRYHHSLNEMWVFSGYRVSFLSLIIFQILYSSLTVLDIPRQVSVIFVFSSVTHHLNIKLYSWMKFLDWIVVTPPYHALHHSNRPELRGKNLGGLFTFFDRIFGTYIDPDTICLEKEELGLGGDKTSTVRMMIGI